MKNICHIDVVCPKCSHINALLDDSTTIDPSTIVSCAECGAALGTWGDLKRAVEEDLEVLHSVKDSQWGGPVPTDQQALDRCRKKGWVEPVQDGSNVFQLTEVGLQVLDVSEADKT